MSVLVTTTRGSRYSDVQRRAAVVEYIVLGNMAKVSEMLGIPETTLSDWKGSYPEFANALDVDNR